VTDSPVGLLAWHCIVYRTGPDPDYVLTNVMIHWLTGTAASAMRIYLEDDQHPVPPEPTRVPLGFAQFREDQHAIRRFAERRHANIASWHTYDVSGHYAAHEVPDVYAADVRAFFRALRVRS